MSSELSIDVLPLTEGRNPKRELPTVRNNLIRDAVIGLADGLTVPFALTAGLSAIGLSHIVVIAGLAELFAGAISMGLGAWLAAKTEQKTYESERNKMSVATAEKAHGELEEVVALFAGYGAEPEVVLPLASQIRANDNTWVKFKLNFLLGISEVNDWTAIISGLTMGLSYLLGGLVPMIPYFAFRSNVNHALFTSIGVTVAILLAFGYGKAMITGSGRRSAAYSALQTLLVGVLAAGTSYAIVRALNTRLGADTSA